MMTDEEREKRAADWARFYGGGDAVPAESIAAALGNVADWTGLRDVTGWVAQRQLDIRLSDFSVTAEERDFAIAMRRRGEPEGAALEDKECF